MFDWIATFFRRIYLVFRTLLSSVRAVFALLWNVPPLRTLAILLVVGFGLFLAWYWTSLARPAKVYDSIWLDQGWTEAQAQKYFQTSQGTLIVPYSWWMSLEQPPGLPRFMSNFLDIGRLGMGERELWRTNENVSSYRLMVDPIPTFNPDRNPIGVTKTTLAPDLAKTLPMGRDENGDLLFVEEEEWLSYSCAACHTGQLNYKGIGIRINGLPSQWSFAKFNTVMTTTLIFTRYWPTKFDRFAERVLAYEGKPDDTRNRDRLKARMDAYLQSFLVTEALHATENSLYPTSEGFGRTAALGRGGNLQFFPLAKGNDKLAKGPVSYPPLWYTHEFDWVQSPGAIRQPLGRNVTESWGVNVVVDLESEEPEKLFRSTHTMTDLFWMETMTSVLDPPAWPEHLFGKIDPELAERGRYLYEEMVNPVQVPEYCDELEAVTIQPPEMPWQPCPNPLRPQKGLCASCHAPVRETVPNQWGKTYIQLPLYQVSATDGDDFSKNPLGTDPWDAHEFNANVGTLDPGTGSFAKEFAKSPWGDQKFGIGTGLAFTLTEIIDGYFEKNPDLPWSRETMEGFRVNALRAPVAYPARPLAGYWATAPFLHNGSVPNLYELLSPVEERSKSFYAGNLEFDPEKLGFESERFQGGFRYRTRRNPLQFLGHGFLGLFRGEWSFQWAIDGNSNAGHEFRDAPPNTPGVIGPALDHDDRMAILEYMKILRDMPPLPPEEAKRRRDLLASMSQDYEAAPEYRPATLPSHAFPEDQGAKRYPSTAGIGSPTAYGASPGDLEGAAGSQAMGQESTARMPDPLTDSTGREPATGAPTRPPVDEPRTPPPSPNTAAGPGSEGGGG